MGKRLWRFSQEELEPSSKLTVDNFHFVALNERAKWRIRKFGEWKTFFFGGEGMVAEVEGPAKLVLQSRTLPPLYLKSGSSSRPCRPKPFNRKAKFALLSIRVLRTLDM